ncbi:MULTISPECIES: ThiF family adenylyltransferase [unclassified Shinella]|uniref:ThiF family adenylyltransferase n=1 Tax=unclassified Shinella TaxID=2643062 RepID=UPI00234EDE12|nr:ThiF family adenylyltransferase [Shinella sp. YE25]MDC7259333.1 ThiF family adenylyltransferase [Shinella sp. YE25]CAK7261512.1 ThiF/MoeB/HesA family protein [Shinella sp. WSC3-e]
MSFSYETFTTRNIGFVSAAEQRRLQGATVFICGTGGMGGAAIQALARAGIGRLVLADIDRFEVSNLNRQVFCFTDTVGQPKAEATRDLCLKINPALAITVFGPDWTEHAEEIVSGADVVINGTDDLGASLLLYRTARRHEKTVIDAYAAPLPSVYVTRPADPMPEERLGYPTTGTAWNALTPDQRAQAFLREAEHVMVHSSSRHHVDLKLAGEVVAGTRSRMSFAPMVISTGMLMAYEAINAVLGRKHGADCRGWFFNPYAGRVERPRSALIAVLLRPLVRRFLNRLAAP